MDKGNGVITAEQFQQGVTKFVTEAGPFLHEPDIGAVYTFTQSLDQGSDTKTDDDPNLDEMKKRHQQLVDSAK